MEAEEILKHIQEQNYTLFTVYTRLLKYVDQNSEVMANYKMSFGTGETDEEKKEADAINNFSKVLKEHVSTLEEWGNKLGSTTVKKAEKEIRYANDSGVSVEQMIKP
jgi:phosphatidate phosphatase PAH1